MRFENEIVIWLNACDSSIPHVGTAFHRKMLAFVFDKCTDADSRKGEKAHVFSFNRLRFVIRRTLLCFV